MEDMAGSETFPEVSMFPGMIQVVTLVIAAHVVADPLAVRVHVRSVWMSFPVPEIARMLFRGALLHLRLLYRRALLWYTLLWYALLGSAFSCRRSLTSRWSRASRRNVSTTDTALSASLPAAMLPTLLCKNGNGHAQKKGR